MRMLLTCNIRRDEKSIEEAEFDSPETIGHIQNALISLGHEVECVEENDDFFDKIRAVENDVELIFNIAEGRKGSYREATVPFILEMFNIPYTGSDPKTLILALDKSLCNSLLASKNILCPRSVLLNRSTIEQVCGLSFPVILKPNFEGSSKGISEASVFGSSTALIRYISDNDIADNTCLAEEYIHGREFTVAALISERRPLICRPMEIVFRKNSLYNVYGFEVKKTGDHYVDFDYAPVILPRIEEKMKKTAVEVIQTLGVRDLARLDFRLSTSGEPYFIEINPLPGLAKNYSDYPNIFRENGIGFDELIERIVENAKERMRQCYE